jgi:hypothetical protein
MCTPALATQPVPIMRTRGFTYRIMSWIVSPASTWPPSECTKTVMSASESAAMARSWALTSWASFEVTSPWIRIVRASSRRSLIRGCIGANETEPGSASLPRMGNLLGSGPAG